MIVSIKKDGRMVQAVIGKYKNVKSSNLKSSVESALGELVAIEKNLTPIKTELSNRNILPYDIGKVVLSALNDVMEPTVGVSSIGALKKYLTTLQTIDTNIISAQEKLANYEKLIKLIQEYAKKDEEDFSRTYYQSLIEKRDKMKLELVNLEEKIDGLVKEICK